MHCSFLSNCWNLETLLLGVVGRAPSECVEHCPQKLLKTSSTRQRKIKLKEAAEMRGEGKGDRRAGEGVSYPLAAEGESAV